MVKRHRDRSVWLLVAIFAVVIGACILALAYAEYELQWLDVVF